VNLNPPLTGLAYWPLVHPFRDKLHTRVPLAATLMDIQTDALVVAFGSGCPFRLLVVYSAADGLVRVKVWELTKQLKEIVSECCLSDLVGEVLTKIASKYGN
jgi:hypothetical protein